MLLCGLGHQNPFPYKSLKVFSLLDQLLMASFLYCRELIMDEAESSGKETLLSSWPSAIEVAMRKGSGLDGIPLSAPKLKSRGPKRQRTSPTVRIPRQMAYV